MLRALLHAGSLRCTALTQISPFFPPQAPAMSSLQMLRLALESLTQPWGLSKGLALAHASPPILGMPLNSPPLKTFKRHCAVVLVGPSGWLNIASSVSSASMRQVGPCCFQVSIKKI